jgi:hypothetical protein
VPSRKKRRRVRALHELAAVPLYGSLSPSPETACRRLADVSHRRLVTGGRYEAHLQAHRVDNPSHPSRGVRDMGATQDLCSRCPACCQGRGSGTRARTRLRVATRLLPVETWRLRLETGSLGASSGEACDVGPTSVGEQSPRLVQHAGTLATLRPQVVAQSSGVTTWSRS